MDAQLKDRNLQDVHIAELNGKLQELREGWKDVVYRFNQDWPSPFNELETGVTEAAREHGFSQDTPDEMNETFGNRDISVVAMLFKPDLLVIIYYGSQEVQEDGDEDLRITLGNIKAVKL